MGVERDSDAKDLLLGDVADAQLTPNRKPNRGHVKDGVMAIASYDDRRDFLSTSYRDAWLWGAYKANLFT
jgi:hypothetical protein